MAAADRHDLARDLYRQVLDLRELLEAVARELERLATDEPSPERRERLHRGSSSLRLRAPRATRLEARRLIVELKRRRQRARAAAGESRRDPGASSGSDAT